MRRYAFVGWLMMVCNLQPFAQSQFRIGEWRDHLPYQQTISVTHTKDAVWVATPFALLRYDPLGHEIERKSKVNGLSGSSISAIEASAQSGKVVVAYANSNIDVVHDEKIFNIDDILTSNIPADKKINHILISNELAYLSSGLGIIVLDLLKMEVKETYVIGNTGNYIEVFRTARTATHLYAATSEGLKMVSVSEPNPTDFSKWNFALPPSSEIQNVIVFNNNILFRQRDSIFTLQNGIKNFFYADGWEIRNETVSENKLLLSETLGNAGRVLEISMSGAVTKILENSTFIKKPEEVIYFHNKYWIADSITGFSYLEGNSFSSLSPDAPAAISTGKTILQNNILWATAGGINENWQPLDKPAGIFSFINNTWTNYTAATIAGFDSLQDIVSVAIDPSDGSAWAGSFGDGLIHIKNVNEIDYHKQNSQLEPAVTSPGSYRISGLSFDADQNLWITNYGAVNNLHVKRKNNTWLKFAIPLQLTENAVADILIDDYNQKWIISPKNGLIVFNHGQQLDVTSDDRYKLLRNGRGNGNLPDNEVLSIAKDKNGLLWVGTANGVGIIACAAEIFANNSCETILPVVQQDNFPGYLFNGERVQVIAIDGADRKWIGTRNGAWLISADGEKTIHRFTTANSPLPDNDIRSISINGKTGEVFFFTVAGTYSYRGTATEATETSESLFVFPNPVPPDYTGAIAIRGKLNNATIKIVELNGRLIYETKASGGQAIWNGKDFQGRKVASGVYLILLTDEAGKEKLSGKIVIIKK